MVVINNDVSRSHEIERDYESPKKRTDPHGEKRQDGQDSGCKVSVGGKHCEAGGQIGAYDALKDKYQAEEAEAVQSCDGPLRFQPVHRFELGPEVGAKAKQPRDIAQDEMNSKAQILAAYCSS